MKFAFIHVEKACFPVEWLCSALDVSRSGYYAWTHRGPSRRAAEDARLGAAIASSHARSRGTYGSPRIHEDLQASGERAGRKRVARLMKSGGIVSKRRRRFRATTDSKHAEPIAPNVLQLLGGLWQGAAWHYVAWGAYHGALLIGQRLLAGSKILGALPRWVQIVAFFQLTCLGWIFFRVDSLGDVPVVLQGFLSGWAGVFTASAAEWRIWALGALLTLPVFLVDLLRERAEEMNVSERWQFPARLTAALTMFVLILLSGVVGGAQFIYFQF